MLKPVLRDRPLLFLLLLSLFVRLFSLFPNAVEHWYTYGFYPLYSRLIRLLLGWIPFSVGDLLYTATAIFLLIKAVKVVRLLVRKRLKTHLSWVLFRKWLRRILIIYLLFNLSWGLNYDRIGIAAQLGLQVGPYTHQDLFELANVLQQRLNSYAALQDTVKRQELDQNGFLFREGVMNYDQVRLQYPFLTYHTPSIKPSIFSPVGHYFGFSGYLNPFTGEAQLNTTEPVFVKPFVVDHELAHQLGYGKENEANFVSYLACKTSANNDFRYSVYYELYFDAYYECLRTGDTAAIRQLRASLHPRARRDKLEELAFRLKKKNGLQPYVSDFYGNYLKLNRQPHGLDTYNEVIAWLIGYMRKFGKEAM
jgi:hypothetical protein